MSLENCPDEDTAQHDTVEVQQVLSDEDTAQHDTVEVQQVQSMQSVSDSVDLLTSSQLVPQDTTPTAPDVIPAVSSGEVSPVSSGEAGMLISTCDTVIFNTNSLSNKRAPSGLDKNGSTGFITAVKPTTEVTDSAEVPICSSVERPTGGEIDRSEQKEYMASTGESAATPGTGDGTRSDMSAGDGNLTVALDEVEIATLRTISPEDYHSPEASPVNDTPDYDESCLPSLASVNSQSNQYTTSTDCTEYPATDYPATDALLYRLQNLLKHNDINLITTKQKAMLNKLECTNQKLMSFNDLSEVEHAKALLSFRHYTKLLLEMRRDVEQAFRRISSIKHKLATQYPAAWTAMAEHSCTDFIDPDEEERLLESRDSVQCAPDQVSQDSFVVVGSYASSNAREGRLGSVEEDPSVAGLDGSTREGEPTLEATHSADNRRISQFPHSPLIDNQECEEVKHYELSDTSITQLNTE